MSLAALRTAHRAIQPTAEFTGNSVEFTGNSAEFTGNSGPAVREWLGLAADEEDLEVPGLGVGLGMLPFAFVASLATSLV